MSWRPLKSIAYAVCTHRYEAVDPDHLSLEIGDDVYITEVGGPTQGWCRGWLLSRPSILNALTLDPAQPLKPAAYAGIFPLTHVELREVLSKDSAVSPASALQDSLVNDRDHGTSSSPPGSPSAELVPLALTKSRSIRRTRAARRPDCLLQLDLVDSMPRSPNVPPAKAPLPALMIGDATRFSVDEPLVDEISACLKEWYSKLHHMLLTREYDLLDAVYALVTQLSNARKQLIHDFLTDRELTKLRDHAIWQLVNGNKLMDGGVVVRSLTDHGRILTAQDDVSEMVRLQAVMSLRSSPPMKHLQDSPVSHVLAHVTTFPYFHTKPAILHMYLCRHDSVRPPRPVSEVFAVEVPADSLHSSDLTHLTRTLFTDLTTAGIGSASDSSTRLYLICMLQRDEPLLADTRADARRDGATNASDIVPDRPDSSTPRDSAERGRRGFIFGSQRTRRLSLEHLRPMTSDSTRSKAPKQHALAPTQDSESRPTTAANEKRVRRTVGYSAVDISSLIKNQEDVELTISLWTPVAPLVEATDLPVIGQDGWEEVLRDLVRSLTGRFSRAESIGPFSLHLKGFAGTDSQSVIRAHPALLRDVHTTQAIAFGPTPQQTRSDIYLTLMEPILPPGAKCFHPQHGSVYVTADSGLRNLQITLEVRTDSGSRVENAIYPTSNRSPHTAFRTPAIDRGEMWNQTIRLSVPTTSISKAHVVLSIADGSNFPFALAWLPLWNEPTQTCREGDQMLALWDYSEYTASTVHGRGAYQSLPSHVNDIQIQSKVSMASLATRLTVTSSVNAQEPSVAALLNWDGETEEGLLQDLQSFRLAPDTEHVKFFKPVLVVLDRIFAISYDMTDDDGAILGEVLAERALSCLVHIFHLTNDRRFTDTKHLFDEYIASREPTQKSLMAVSRAFHSVLGKPYEAEEARELRNALKVSGLIIKFITNNHDNASQTPIGMQFISRALVPIQNAALNLLRNPRKDLYPTQVILMQSLSTWLPEMISVCTSDEVLDFVEEVMAVSASKKDSLRISRLVLLRDLSVLEPFMSKDERHRVLLRTTDWLEPYWSTSEVIADNQVDSIRMCCSIINVQRAELTNQSLHYIVKLVEAYHLLAAHMHGTGVREDAKVPKLGVRNMFSLPFPTTYPFPAMEVETACPEVVLVEIATLLTAFFQNGPPVGDIRDYDMGGDNDEALEVFVVRALQVLNAIQAGRAFPPQWISLYISHAKVAITILQWLFGIMRTNFLPADDAAALADIMSFNTELWELWFTTLIELALNKTVSMENFSEQTSRAIWTIGGDIRDAAASLLRYSWECLGWKADSDFERAILPMKRLGGFQVGLTAKLIPFVARLCMGLHSGLRSVGLDVLRTMIISEWQLNENLELIQAALFDAFDMNSTQDVTLGKAFTSSFLLDLRRHFKVIEATDEGPLYEAVIQMIQEVEKLLAVLNEFATVHDPGSQLVQRSYVAEFLRISGKHDAYIRRLHEISVIHTQTRNYSSAAVAIQLHVDLLHQDKTDQRGSKILPALDVPGLSFPQESAHARKIRLAQHMAALYEKSHCWESVMDVLKQLAQECSAVWDSTSLADICTRQGHIFRLLSHWSTSGPRYFYVAFNENASFPALLRGKQYIFEGPADCDRRSFCQALYHQFPFMSNFSPEYSHPNAQSVDAAAKIIPVTAYKEHLHPISQQSGVSASYREHCLTAKPRMFAITDRQDAPQVSIIDQIVEKRIFATQAVFPTLLSYSQIVSEKKITLSPLQAAIDRTQRKTQILSVATYRVADRGQSELGALIDSIESSVNPNANGSVAQYHRLLMVPPESSDGDTTNGASSSLYAAQDMHQSVSEEALLRNALSVALEDHARSIECALPSPLIMDSTRTRLRTFFATAFALELHNMYPAGDWERRSPAFIDPVTEQNGTAVEQQNGTDPANEGEQTKPQRKRSASRRSSLRQRLSFLSIGGKAMA